jgi:hypothetical protein
MAPISEFQPVKAEPGRPLFLSVRDSIRQLIDSGRFAPGAQLPSTKALAEQINVSLVTVHRALQELVASGVLRRGQGRGTFVHESYLDRAAAMKPDGSEGSKLSGLRIGLVFHDECSLADFYHGHVAEGVRRGALDLHADLVILRFGEDFRRECAGFIYVNPMRAQLNSMPWFGTGSLPAGKPVVMRSRSSRRRRPPVMVVGASFDHDHVHSIDTDNVDLAVQGVRHLAALGHRRIAYLGGGLEICNNIDRWKGFRQGCAEAGVEFDDRLTLRVPGWRLTTPQQRQQLGALLRGPGRATAIFAAGYYFALDVYGAAAEAGLTIPGDLSVVGVDDPPSAEHLSPPMTTLRQPLEQMGRMAAAGLGQLVQRADSWPRLTRLRAELIVRGSTAKAPAESANRRRD